MMQKTLAMTTASLLLGASAVQAKDKGLEEAYVEAVECRVAAKVVQDLPRSDDLSEEGAALLAKAANVEASYAAASRWVGSKIGKDALRVKAEFAIGMLGVARNILEGKVSSLDYAKTAISCAEAIQEAES